MSFWSKLGLADTASLEAMKEEILALRQENCALHNAQEQHAKQAQDSCLACVHEIAASVESKVAAIGKQTQALQPELISCLRDSKKEILFSGDSHRDHVIRQLTVVLENQESLKESLSSAATSRKQALAKITELLTQMRSVQEQANENMGERYSELHKACQMISDRLGSLQAAADTQSNVSKGMVEQLDSELKEVLAATQGVVEDISFLNKYTESLWEAMKLVWINDLLDDANKQVSQKHINRRKHDA